MRIRLLPILVRALRRGLVAACAFIAAPALAQQDCPSPPALDAARLLELKANARDHGFLWRAEKDGRVSWLYGTIHAGRPEWLIPGPTVMQAIAGSDVVAVELDLTDPAVLRALNDGSGAEASRRLLDAPRRERIERIAQRNCVPMPALQAQRPIMQALVLMLFDARRIGVHPELAIDPVLMGLARSLGKRLVALETAQRQIAAITPPTDADELELVDTTLADLESAKSRRLLDRLSQVWARGDEPSLLALPDWCECLRTPAEKRMHARLNDERNGDLAERIAALHDGGARVFAGVGLLHMTGSRALTDLLRARGFTVQRVTFRTP